MRYYYLFIISVFFPTLIFSQNTYIPDNGFEQLLIDISIDFGPLDNYVPTANIAGLEDLNILSNYNITDLTGLQDFTSIEALNIINNPITTIDLSGNPILYDVNLTNLNLNSITFSSNSIIAFLDLSNNSLSNIDLSELPNLQYLNLEGNQITDLDLSSKTQLTSLNVKNNLLTSLNVKNGFNTNISSFDATNNTLLTCIEVDDSGAAIAGTGNYSSWLKDNTSNYSENCNPLSISDNSLNSMITIYPNPVSNGEILKFSNLNQDFVLTIYDFTGKLIDKKIITDNQYRIINFSKGVYFYTLQIDSNIIRNKFIVY